MGNNEVINYFPGDGIREVKTSEQAELTTTEAVTVKRITILGRIATGKYAFYDSGDDPVGSGIPVAVSLSEVVAGALGDFPVGVLLQGKVREEDLIIHGNDPGDGITEAIKDQLRTYGIIVESIPECGVLDNQ